MEKTITFSGFQSEEEFKLFLKVLAAHIEEINIDDVEGVGRGYRFHSLDIVCSKYKTKSPHFRVAMYYGDKNDMSVDFNGKLLNPLPVDFSELDD